MKKVIKTLEKKIEQLNHQIKEAEKVMEEPEMVCDYEFALTDAANAEAEIIEHQKAIEILNKVLVEQ